MTGNKLFVPSTKIENTIQFIRGQKVILSFHLAEMYSVQTKVLVQAVKRNRERFPKDFMFQLTAAEWEGLRSQFVTLNQGSGKGPKYLPYAFTEQGVAMLSSVLNSPRAVQVNIEIMRAFVRLRRMVVSNADLALKIDELEKKYDRQFAVIFEAIRRLMEPPKSGSKRPLGFTVEPGPDNRP
ncbi:MAG: ORF6N domain-containing protein [Anaerolineales bacterium]